MKAIRVKTTIDTAKAGEIAARGVSSGLVASADYMVGQIKQSMAFRKSPSPPGSPPAVGPTGMLMNGIARTDPKGGSLYVHTSQTRYARIQEKGGTIRPVKTQYLAIPLSYQAKRLAGRTSQAGNSSLRKAGIPMVVRKSKAGNLLLFAGNKWGSGKSRIRMGEPLFVLKKSITLPARPYMAPAGRNTAWIAEATRVFSRRARQVINQGVSA